MVYCINQPLHPFATYANKIYDYDTTVKLYRDYQSNCQLILGQDKNAETVVVTVNLSSIIFSYKMMMPS